MFTVSIPFGTSHLPPDRLVEDVPLTVPETEPRLYVEEAHWWLGEPTARSPMAAETGGVRDGRRGRVLLADDNADLRDHLARLLRPYWDVTTAVDGLDALERATS